MKKSAVILFPFLLIAPLLVGQQGQAALPVGSVPPAAAASTAAPAANQPSDQTVVEEIIVRINSSIISLSDLQRSDDQLKTEQSKADPNIPAESQPQ